jgi:hypothetical protein
MKTIDLPVTPPEVASLLDQARTEDVIVRLADGSEFLLVSIEEFDLEIARSRANPKLMDLLERRAREPATLPWSEVKRQAGL